ncbi:MAG: protein kinase [Myxococcota bacterium]
MAGNGNDLGPCPFCGQFHSETVLLCPVHEKLLPLEGRILDGKFRFVRMLGEGGMGAVWKAENVLVKKTVAIKLMHVQFSKDEGVLARFRNEATAAGRIGSEHICDILDLGRSDLGPYIVMEMLRGKDFAVFLQQRQGKVDPGLSVLVVREALTGLAAAHQVGIVHRDLKPENIFLHEPKPGQLMVKLMDFGISKFTEGSEAGKTGMGVLMGTPEYMSPEQTEGAAQVDHRTDIWAMGVILYWALSGRNPFLGPTMAATLVNVSTKEPPPLQSLGGHIDPGLVEIIARCLRKNPAERWDSCEQLSAALAPYENRNNGLYVVAGTSSSAPTGPGRTVASVGTPTPPPGATVASPSGMPPLGAGPTGGGLGGGLGGGPGSGLGMPPGMHSPTSGGAAPTFVGGNPTGAGNSPTWSSEFPGSRGSAPTLGGNAFGLTEEQIERRPDTSLGGGAKGGMIVLMVVLLALLGGGAWFGYRTFVKGKADPVASDQTPTVADDGDEASDNSKADADADAAAGSGAAEVAGGIGAAAPNSADAGAPTTEAADGGQAETGTTGDDPAEDDGKDDGKDDGGSANGGKSGGGKSGGGKAKPKKPDLDKVKTQGGMFAPKASAKADTLTIARSACKSMNKARFGNLRDWKLPTQSQLLKFVRLNKRPRARPVYYWLNSGKLWNNTTGRTTIAPGNRLTGARVVCVTK